MSSQSTDNLLRYANTHYLESGILRYEFKRLVDALHYILPITSWYAPDLDAYVQLITDYTNEKIDIIDFDWNKIEEIGSYTDVHFVKVIPKESDKDFEIIVHPVGSKDIWAVNVFIGKTLTVVGNGVGVMGIKCY